MKNNCECICHVGYWKESLKGCIPCKGDPHLPVTFSGAPLEDSRKPKYMVVFAYRRQILRREREEIGCEAVGFEIKCAGMICWGHIIPRRLRFMTKPLITLSTC